MVPIVKIATPISGKIHGVRYWAVHPYMTSPAGMRIAAGAILQNAQASEVKEVMKRSESRSTHSGIRNSGLPTVTP